MLADTSMLRTLAEPLGKRASLKLFQDADHSFHVPVRTGRTDAEVRAEKLDASVLAAKCGLEDYRLDPFSGEHYPAMRGVGIPASGGGMR